MKQIILIIITCSLCSGLHAQLGKRILNRAKNSAEHKVNSKIDRKVDETVDKGINEVDTLLTGKKKSEKEAEKKQTQPTNSDSQPAIKSTNQNTSVSSADTIYKPAESSGNFALRMNSENTFTTIFTNCNCESGKKKLETALRKTNGVASASIDVSNGRCQIAYTMGKVKYSELITAINNLGFEADGSPAANGKTGCK